MNKRFFLISYSANRNENGNTVNGMDSVIQLNGNFFNNNDFMNHLSLNHGLEIKSIVILNIFEFQNESDFNEFVKDSL